MQDILIQLMTQEKYIMSLFKLYQVSIILMQLLYG